MKTTLESLKIQHKPEVVSGGDDIKDIKEGGGVLARLVLADTAPSAATQE